MEFVFVDSNNNQIDHLTQWDIGQSLNIKTNIFNVPPVFHFCNIKSQEALVVQSTLNSSKNVVSVNIPNILLQQEYPIIAFVYEYSDQNSGKSIAEIRINVHKRPKPSYYSYVENIDKVSASAINSELKTDIANLTNNVKTNYVSFTSTQTLTDNQKEKARSNIGAISYDEASKCALYELTSSTKEINVVPGSSGLIGATWSSSETTWAGLWYFYSATKGVIVTQIVPAQNASVEGSTYTSSQTSVKISLTNSSSIIRHFSVMFMSGGLSDKS